MIEAETQILVWTYFTTRTARLTEAESSKIIGTKEYWCRGKLILVVDPAGAKAWHSTDEEGLAWAKGCVK